MAMAAGSRRPRLFTLATLFPSARLYGGLLAFVGLGCASEVGENPEGEHYEPSSGAGGATSGGVGGSVGGSLGGSGGGGAGRGGASGPGGGAGRGGAPGPGGMPGSTGGAGNTAGQASGTGGTPAGGAPGSGATSGAGGGTPVAPGAADPVIPAIAGECPVFESSTITFMGLAGIQIVAGNKPAGPTAPMLFYWHGTGGRSSEFQTHALPVAEALEQQGGVLVSFQNTTGGDLYSGLSVFGESDLNVVDQLVACAVRDANVDPRRVYTTGCSAGGLFATAMAALRSTYVAAAAPNSGGYVVQPPFENEYTPALMTVHGAPGNDVVIVDFSDTSAAADAYFKSHGGFVVNCNTGGAHCGGSILAGDAWTFLEAHPYGVSPEPWAGGLPAGFSNLCAIQ
jgi:dienelactone hydrolase